MPKARKLKTLILDAAGRPKSAKNIFVPSNSPAGIQLIPLIINPAQPATNRGLQSIDTAENSLSPKTALPNAPIRSDSLKDSVSSSTPPFPVYVISNPVKSREKDANYPATGPGVIRLASASLFGTVLFILVMVPKLPISPSPAGIGRGGANFNPNFDAATR